MLGTLAETDLENAMWNDIAAAIRAAGATAGESGVARPVGGGDINAAYRFETGTHRYFVKCNRRPARPMFDAEAAALTQLGARIRVPQPVCTGVTGDTAFLVLEWLDLARHGDDARLGEALADVHRLTMPRYGWDIDNTIGSTAQANGWLGNWADFWARRRLAPQLALAATRGAHFHEGETLLAQLPVLFDGHAPAASLLHGDLWSGNAAFLADGIPVLFDPASYFGDRETDLAMTELFGGFSPRFYDAYRAAWPLDAGYAVRRTLYQLYHVLNHFNLFGGHYRHEAGSMMGRLLAELR
ncbi:fructosamine kinase family protein [Jeongeupia chitinilytica]|uniref:Fructosamine kinase family protein n=1 Tax=Jeongeupia chitinilytica TaxID=1041641 RepID=A0ABQ3H301_9NEIS|nr:fructosamine kinase family protein [Jeongeupia chitinilytica]GHD67774.1 fructosamine kinase family protein [Jeongeupia chitinilytica]